MAPTKKVAPKKVSFAKKGPAAKKTKKVPPPPPAMPGAAPGGPIEIVFSFDTTGSMGGCIAEVRKQVQEVITRLFTDIPNLRVAVFAHGDYCDSRTYVTKYVDFTNDCKKLCNFVNTVKTTGGGDWEECYELVLKQTREELSWQAGSQRSLVMIGDAIPHEPSYSMNKGKIDWRKETDKLRDEMGVHIYAVQCQNNSSASFFYEELANKTHGKHLKLDQFATIVDMIMGICYREHGPEFYCAYEKEIREREGGAIRAELDRMLVTLRDPETPAAGGSPSDGSLSDGSSSDDSSSSVASDEPKTTKSVIKGSVAKRSVKRKAASSAAAKLIKRAKKDGTKILPRENEISAYFALSNMAWSPWKPILAPTKPTSGNWSKTRKRYSSFRNKGAFSKASSRPAVWEFAVQNPTYKRNIPVFCKVTDRYNPAKRSCDVHMLKQRNIRNQAESVITNGCKLLVRRASFRKDTKFNEKPVNNTRELRKLIKDTYDYAWSSNKTTGRDLEKKSVRFSKEL